MGYELEVHAVIQGQFHGHRIRPGIEGEEALTGQVGIHDDDGMGQQGLEGLPVRLEGYPAGGVDRQVRPDLVNVLEIIVLDYFTKHHHHPGGDAGQSTHVPLRRFLGDALYPLVPVVNLGNFQAGLVEAFHEFRHIAHVDAADLSLLVAVALLQMGGAAEHQNVFLEQVRVKIEVGQTFGLCTPYRLGTLQHRVRHRNAFALLSGSTATQGEKARPAGPGDVGIFSLFFPPLLVHLVVIEDRHFLLVGFADVFGLEDAGEVVVFAEGGVLGRLQNVP